MDFTEEQTERLLRAYGDYEPLIVTACNGFGKEFTVQGHVATLQGNEIAEISDDPDKFYIAVMKNGLVLDCGDIETCAEDEIRTKYSTIMFTWPEGKDYKDFINFFIKNIISAQNRDVIYYNPNYNKLQNFCFKNFLGRCKSQLKKGVVPAVWDKEGKTLNQNVGKPININGSSGILYCVDQILPNGSIKIFHVSGRTIKSAEIPREQECVIKNGILITKAKNSQIEKE